MTGALIEEILSSTGVRRALILQRADGAIEVAIERKVPGDGEYEPSYWSRVGNRVILADSVERARQLAREELATLG